MLPPVGVGLCHCSDVPGAPLSRLVSVQGCCGTWGCWECSHPWKLGPIMCNTEKQEVKNGKAVRSPFLPLFFLLLRPHVAEPNRNPAHWVGGDAVCIIPTTYYREQLRRVSQKPQNYPAQEHQVWLGGRRWWHGLGYRGWRWQEIWQEDGHLWCRAAVPGVALGVTKGSTVDSTLLASGHLGSEGLSHSHHSHPTQLGGVEHMCEAVFEAPEEMAWKLVAEPLQQNIDHILWLEQLENIITCTALRPTSRER